jgi:hypothetical protein
MDRQREIETDIKRKTGKQLQNIIVYSLNSKGGQKVKHIYTNTQTKTKVMAKI